MVSVLMFGKRLTFCDDPYTSASVPRKTLNSRVEKGVIQDRVLSNSREQPADRYIIKVRNKASVQTLSSWPLEILLRQAKNS
jgi:hypothetical protein